MYLNRLNVRGVLITSLNNSVPRYQPNEQRAYLTENEIVILATKITKPSTTLEETLGIYELYEK